MLEPCREGSRDFSLRPMAEGIRDARHIVTAHTLCLINAILYLFFTRIKNIVDSFYDILMPAPAGFVAGADPLRIGECRAFLQQVFQHRIMPLPARERKCRVARRADSIDTGIFPQQRINQCAVLPDAAIMNGVNRN